MATHTHAGSRTLPQQAARLRAAYPDGEVVLRPRRLTWTSHLTPVWISREYTVEVVLEERKSPKVNVLAPDLKTLSPGALPHVYNDGSLCLYQSGEWNDSMFIAETIVPWTIVWLAQFEIWLVDRDEWYGNEEPTHTVGQAPIPTVTETDGMQNRAARRATQRWNSQKVIRPH